MTIDTIKTAILPDGRTVTNFALFFDSLDTRGHGYLQWNEFGNVYTVRFLRAYDDGTFLFQGVVFLTAKVWT